MKVCPRCQRLFSPKDGKRRDYNGATVVVCPDCLPWLVRNIKYQCQACGRECGTQDMTQDGPYCEPCLRGAQ